MKYFATTLVGIITGILAIAWIIFPYYNRMNYTSIIWQEIDVPNAALGFEHSVGYDRGQDFYWEEVTNSKAYKIELLKELGREIGPYKRENGFLPYLVFKKLIKTNTKEEDDRLFLGIRNQFRFEPYLEAPPKLKEELEAATQVFARIIGERGVPSKKVGKAFLETQEVNTPKDILQRIGYKVFLGTLASSWLILFLSSRKKNNPNQAILTTSASTRRES